MKNMTDDESTQFLPFTAINNFMISEFRHRVLCDVLGNNSSLPIELRNQINQSIRQRVTVPGFRNPTKAPISLLAKKSVRLFEDSPEFASAVLAGWAAAHPILAENMYSLLDNMDWEVLPVDADRTQMPGFFIEWPPGTDFDTINQHFETLYPDAVDDPDSISLMAVWISLRLPRNSEVEQDSL